VTPGRFPQAPTGSFLAGGWKVIPDLTPQQMRALVEISDRGRQEWVDASRSTARVPGRPRYVRFKHGMDHTFRQMGRCLPTL